jgi:Galactose oxidase, central domain
MTYDSARSRTILFGGDSLAGAFLNDTWEWNGQYWTQIADIGPDPRRDHAMCFDSVRNVVLLFGGTSEQAPFGDTWSWNGQDWTQLDDTGPSGRAGHAMVFDSARGRAVLFGGETATGLVNETWEWDGEAWTQQEDIIGPSPRKYHAMAFDVVHNQAVLFGGNHGNGNALGDTWSWDGSNWTQMSHFGASPCMRAAMVSTDVQIAIFGGLNSSKASPAPTVFHESWVFDGKHWTHRQDIGPGPRCAHATAFDSTRRSIVLFGGLPIFGTPGDTKLPSQLLGDTWEHIETDPAAAAASSPALQSLTLSGTAKSPSDTTIAYAVVGENVTAKVKYSMPVPKDTYINLFWVVQKDFNNWFLPTSQHPLNDFIVPAGKDQAYSSPFKAPNQIVTEPLLIMAVDGSTIATATLQQA